MIVLIITIFSCLLGHSAAFMSALSQLKSPRVTMCLSAATKLIVKSKVKDIEYINSNSEIISSINSYVSEKTRPFGISNPIDFFQSMITKSGTLSIMPEYNKKCKTGFIIGMPPPEIMGGVLRESGSKAIVVSLDKRSGGASYEEFERFTKEQSKARIFIPGPISIVWNDFIINKIQISYAATLGAAAITIYPEFFDNNEVLLKEYVDYCKELNIEPILMIKNEMEARMGFKCKVRSFLLHALNEKELVALRTLLPDGDYLYGAKLLPEVDFSMYAEIDTTWILRDNKFNFVWPSPEAVYTSGMTDIYGVVFAMRSKASSKFLSPRQFLMDRKKEGATEYLGDILY